VTVVSDVSTNLIADEDQDTVLQRLYAVLDHSKDLIWITSADDFRILWANSTANEYLQKTYNIGTCLGFSLADIGSPRNRARLNDILAAALKKGQETRIYHTRNRDKVLLITLSLVDRQDPDKGICIIGRDITDLHKTEVELLMSEQRYRSVINSMVEGVVFLDNTGAMIDANPAALFIMGRTPDEVIGTRPVDIEWGAVREDGSPFPNEDHPISITLSTGKILRDVVMGIRRPSGELRWLSINSAPVYIDEEDGGLVREIVATFHDITEQKNREHELRVSATAFDRSQEAMMIADPNQRILKINESFTRLTGYRPEEVVGNTPNMLSSGRHDRTFYQNMWQSLLTNHHWQGEIWNKRKNGELYPEWLSITAVMDDKGKVTNYVGTFIDLTSQKDAEKQINDLQFYDPLTGLANRRLLFSLIRQSLQRDETSKHASALLFVNIDDFKDINDRFGHNEGDLVLQTVADRLSNLFRGGDFTARLSNDVFAVLLGDLPADDKESASVAESLANKIHEIISETIEIKGVPLRLTTGIGICIAAEGKLTAAEMLRRADIAMYQAKQIGRRQTHFFDEAIQARMEQKILLRERLSLAIPSQLQLLYQMQVDTSGHCYGAEVLLRWVDPIRGVISPADFIPVAEESDLIFPIGRWVLQTACEQIKQWSTQPGYSDLIISVNLSAREFSRADFIEQVSGTIQRSGIDPSRLCIELTEGTLLTDTEIAISKMAALREIGVHFSLDDFGTGYSSLSYLKRLPLNELKIDRSFLPGIETDPNDKAIVSTIIALGRTLGLEVVAEGVETEAQHQALVTLGCQKFQGYMFARPLPLEDFEKLVKANRKI